jgi:pimeloyl-ACP methyl ester carboxylesterase
MPNSDTDRTPQPGTRLVAIGKHRIAFHVTPGDEPVIVLDAGGGLDASYWNALIPQISRRTGCRIIRYDRAGFGASDEVEGPWDVQSATDDLEYGLRSLEATADLILVSHSLAGEIATCLARRHPDWLRGVVLVDANLPPFFTDEVIAQMGAAYQPIIAAARADASTKPNRQLLAVADSFEARSRSFHHTAWPPSVPAIVIVSESTPFETALAAQWWRQAQALFASEADNRRLVVAERSSHDVVLDRPDLILDAIAHFTG